MLSVQSQTTQEQLNTVKTELNKKTTESYIKARLILEDMVEKNQVNSDVYAYLSEIYCHLYYKNLNYRNEKELLEKAEQYSVQSYNLNKKNYLAFRALGNVLILKGNFEKAKTFFNYILAKLNPNDADTWYYSAVSQKEDITDENSKAYSDLHKALTENYTHLWSLQDFILAYIKKGDLEKAEFYYNKLLENFPDHPENDYYCAMMNLYQNNYPKSKKCFQSYVEKNTYSNFSSILSSDQWNKD